MGLAPPAAVAPPFAQPPRVGLLPSIRNLAGAAGERWQGSFSFAPEGCGEAGVADPCNSGPKDIADNRGVIDVEPFTAWAGDKCSPWELGREYKARAQRQLAAAESYQIAQELWSGSLAISKGWPNRYLTSEASDVLTSTPTTPTNALACLEHALGRCEHGGRGMIHATRQAVTHWAALNLVRRDAGLLITALDTIVIPDAGYDGSGPYGAAAEGSAWAYATGPIQLRLDAVVVIPDTEAEALDRSVNTFEYRAERLAAVTWDGCCHLAVEMDLPLCGIGGAGS